MTFKIAVLFIFGADFQPENKRFICSDSFQSDGAHGVFSVRRWPWSARLLRLWDDTPVWTTWPRRRVPSSRTPPRSTRCSPTSTGWTLPTSRWAENLTSKRQIFALHTGSECVDTVFGVFLLNVACLSCLTGAGVVGVSVRRKCGSASGAGL